MPGTEPEHPLFAAVYDPATWLAERTLFARHRSWLARDLHGVVLDLGAGTGATFPHFRSALEDDPGIELRATDPDPHMRSRARDRAEGLGLPVTVRADPAEDLSDADGSVDVVVAVLVLCTVADPAAALDEVARVLRPGGEVRFLEHVHAGGIAGRVQSLLAPAWARVAGGCQLDRSTGERLRGDDRFEVVSFERFRAIPPVDPLVRGVARRREG